MTNPIEDGYSLFFEAYDATVSAAGGKPVWVTETGWPISGPTENQAVPSTQNAKTYWDAVGCGRLFGQVNTWWYTLQDAFPTTPSPSFGIVGTTLSDTPLYDLSCSGASSSTSNKVADTTAAVSSVISSAEAGSVQAGAIPATAKIGSGSAAVGEASGSVANVAPAETSAAAGGAATVQGSSASAPIAASEGSTSAGPQPVVTSAIQPEGTAFSTEAVTITSCSGGCPKETQTQPTVTAASAPSTLITKTSVLSAASEATASASSCPASLSGAFEYPHLIVPVNKNEPDTASGTSYNGTISPSVSSIFNFDIPSSASGKTCTLVFLLPTQGDLTTSAFGLSGSGGFDVAELSSPATESTTYKTVSSVAKDLGGPSDVKPGNEYVIASGSCPAGSRVGYEVSSTGGLDLSYFQDVNPSPIGFYVTVC